MQKRITFRHMEHEPVLDAYIDEQLKKLEDFLKTEREPIYLELVIEPHHLHAHHKAELILKSPRFEVFVHKVGTDIYLVISTVIDEVYKQVEAQKRAYVDQHKDGMQHSGEVPELLRKQMHIPKSEEELEDETLDLLEEENIVDLEKDKEI